MRPVSLAGLAIASMLGTGCGTLPNRMTPLDTVSSPVTQPLEGACVDVEVIDPRDDKSIYLVGAFNLFKSEGTDNLSFVRHQFETSARSRGAISCQVNVSPTTVRVSIHDLVFDSAYFWPFSSHQCRVALDVVAEKRPLTILRELELHRSARFRYPTDPPPSWERIQHVWNVPHCLSAQVRELAESFNEDPQVQELLIQEE